jgi:DNA-binding GntR family transcriptional regulator
VGKGQQDVPQTTAFCTQNDELGAMNSPVAGITKGLAHRTLAAATAEELRRRILTGSFPAGYQLRQDALASEFGISRIPLREALLQLEAEGLIKIIPHRGAVVSELSIAEIEELFDLRALLEPWLLLASGPCLTAADFGQLNAILNEYSHELRTKNVVRWGELNTRFHLMLYQHSNRPRTMTIVTALLQASDRHTRLQLSYTDGMQRAEKEHAELVKLCSAKAFAAASELLKAHILNVKSSLTNALSEIASSE